jgi:hypothetical protein
MLFAGIGHLATKYRRFSYFEYKYRALVKTGTVIGECHRRQMLTAIQHYLTVTNETAKPCVCHKLPMRSWRVSPGSVSELSTQAASVTSAQTKVLLG